MSPGIGFGTVVSGHPTVEVAPSVHERRLGGTAHRVVVGVAYGNQPAMSYDPAHLTERGDRVGEVLENLMGVDNVKRPAVEGQVVDRGFPEGDVGCSGLGAMAAGRLEDTGHHLDSHHLPVGDPSGQARSDRPRSTTHVEDPQRAVEVGEQERSGGLNCASGVLLDDGRLMPVGVDVPLHLADGSCLLPVQRPGIGGWVDDPGSPNRAGHVRSTTHGGLDLAVIVRTAGDLDCRPVVTLDGVIDQRRVTGTACGVDRHPAGRAFVGSHL